MKKTNYKFTKLTKAQEARFVKIAKECDRLYKIKSTSYQDWRQVVRELLNLGKEYNPDACWGVSPLTNYEGYESKEYEGFYVLEDDGRKEKILCTIDLSMIDLGDYEIYYYY